MLSHEERRNMVQFITKALEIEVDRLIYMTDAMVEHFYNKAYSPYECEI
jgi:hypothetical protein